MGDWTLNSSQSGPARRGDPALRNFVAVPPPPEKSNFFKQGTVVKRKIAPQAKFFYNNCKNDQEKVKDCAAGKTF